MKGSVGTTASAENLVCSPREICEITIDDDIFICAVSLLTLRIFYLLPIQNIHRRNTSSRLNCFRYFMRNIFNFDRFDI